MEFSFETLFDVVGIQHGVLTDVFQFAAAVATSPGIVPIPGRDVWFSAGEGKYIVEANVRGGDVYVLQRAMAPGSRVSLRA